MKSRDDQSALPILRDNQTRWDCLKITPFVPFER